MVCNYTLKKVAISEIHFLQKTPFQKNVLWEQLQIDIYSVQKVSDSTEYLKT